jgi:FKBP-type peptidyl-prolyl cis-trans isomerase
MKKLLIVAAVVAVIFGAASCGVGGGRIQNDVDTMAYAYGVHFGLSLKEQDSTINANLVAKGVIDAFNGKAPSMDSVKQLLDEYYQVKFPAKRQKEEVAYLESVVAKNPNAVKAESGLIYEIVMPGDTSIMPTEADNVKIKYVGRTREGLEYDANKVGKEFDSNDSLDMQLGYTVAGFKEGLQKVGKGGKIRLWIPSALGYGEQGGGQFMPYETLYFEVDVLDVVPPAATEEEIPAN